MRTRTVLLVVLVCLGVPGTPAGAATSLHVAPAPANPNGACDANDPCSLARALLIGTTGDDVTVAPGGYVLQANGIGTGIFLHGEAGRPAPEIVLPSALLAVQGGGGIRHLHVTGQSTSTPLSFSGAGTVEDVVIRSSGADADGLDVVGVGGSAVVRDVAVSGPGLLNGIVAEGNVTMRNVTAVTGRPNGDAIKVFAPNGLNTVVDARNVIAVATAGQDLANVNIFAGETSVLRYGWANVRPARIFDNGGTMQDLGHDQAGDPRLADPASGDLHLLPDSPAIDAGTNDTLGPHDPDGLPRILGAAPDMGAYEAALPGPAAATGAAAGVTRSGATLAGAVDPNGRAATYHFELGTSVGYGRSTAAAPAGNGTAALPVSAAVSGLAAGTTYHYRLVASGPFGTAAGADRTFTTPNGARFAGVALLTTRVKPDRRRRIALRLRCPKTTPGRCRGTVDLVLPLARGAAAKLPRFSIAAGRTGTVRVTLAKVAALRIPRKGLRVRLAIVTRDGSGRTASVTRALRLLR